jgi:hypothetical protein
MKRLIIKILALCLLAQPILANPLMMQGARAHQSMVVMSTVLNTQKQNTGIFNNNVQKRTFIPAIVIPVAAAGVMKGIAAGSTIIAAIILSMQDKKQKKGPESLIITPTYGGTGQNFSANSVTLPMSTLTPASTTIAPNSVSIPPDAGGSTMGDVGTGIGSGLAIGAAAEKTAEVVAQKTLWGVIKGAVGPYVQPVASATTTAANSAWGLAVANPVTATIITGTVTVGGGYALYNWWTTPTTKVDAGCVLPAQDPLAGITNQHPIPVVEAPKTTGCGSTVPEKIVLTPQEIPAQDDPLFFEKNKKGEEEVRANNAPGALRETGAQAPGMPRDEDGYTPPKNWDGNKVKVEKGKCKGQYGWPDKKGNIWVPSGPKGHGGPHWDVQYPNEDYDNVVPGGGIRGKK